MHKEYAKAQLAIANLKGTIYSLLENSPKDSLSNAEIGRNLGIYSGHKGHEGHISRTLLAMMEKEGVIEQDEDTKEWSLT
ncbi:hypothetical protein CK503_07175 [Aliifodinibius salipaludis]|uniref:MarR family transcriptional regulator n=1 Tax=Fodinibius salipaludis TaxID=2032627 RepID=A0A2A2GB61_9BACT|nr:hypothetical protein [Aliifodinibius salipaludis]PAU94568.1 hypothetical protein CK503_07175 [Aliifodinibius salipaludis]